MWLCEPTGTVLAFNNGGKWYTRLRLDCKTPYPVVDDFFDEGDDGPLFVDLIYPAENLRYPALQLSPISNMDALMVVASPLDGHDGSDGSVSDEEMSEGEAA
jgi:hypothetical protein